MWGLIIALLSGALMSVQGVFNTQVTKASGIWAAGCFVQLSALLVSLAAWAISERSPFSAGPSGTAQIHAAGRRHRSLHHLYRDQKHGHARARRAVMLIVVAQLLVAYLIELFGMFGVEKAAWDWRKAVGMALAIAGIVVFKWEPGK